MVAQAISLDKSSDIDFGKLSLKAQFASTRNTLLIQPERVEEFLNANFTSPSITVSKDTLKQALSVLSASMNQAVFTFCSQLCQVPSIANTAAATGMAQQAGIDDHANTAAGTSKNVTTSIVPVSNTSRGTTELLETDEHSYSGQQQEISKDCTTDFAGSTEILENTDDGSYSGQQKEESEEKESEREKGSPPNAVDVAGSSQARSDDLLGPLFEVSASGNPLDAKGLVAAKRPATNYYSRRAKHNTSLQQAARDITNVEATCNAPSDRAQCGATQLKNVMSSAAFEAAPDLEIDSPSKSQGSSTESIIDTRNVSVEEDEAASSERRRIVPKIDTRNVSPKEDVSYRLVCKWGGKPAEGVTCPTVFKSKQLSATSYELANSIAMGKCLSIVAIQVGTFVLSEDPSQVRKLIMSPLVSQRILSSPKDTSTFVEKAFHFINTDYDLILFPILESYGSEPHASGHWFTFVINLKDKKFQVIDSARLKDNPALLKTVRKFTFYVITLWRMYTSTHAGCTVPTISNFKVHYVEGYRQFGIHDCGLFTLKAIEYFDGERAPEFIGSNELNLRKQILYEWLTSPSNAIDWNNI